MKKVLVLLLALLIAFALVGCNIAPNVPAVTPYGNTRYGNMTGTYGTNRSGTYGGTNRNVPANSPLVRSGVNPADKVILPGAGAR